MLICSNCSIPKGDREGMGCVLVLHHYGLVAANHSRKGITLYHALLFPCLAVSLAVTAWMMNRQDLVYSCFAVGLSHAM